MQHDRIVVHTVNDEELAVELDGTAPPWLGRLTQRIDELLRLPANWDSYGASPISPSAATTALRALLRAADSATPVPQAVPTVVGGVQLEWHERGIDLELAANADGRMSLYYFDHRTGEEWEEDPEANLSKLQAALDEMVRRG